MRIFLLRHGDALFGGDDSQRELSERGIEEVARLAEKLKNLKIAINKIIHSDYKRAVKTAELFASHTGLDCPMETDIKLRPSGPLHYWTDRLLAEDQTLLVGHMPLMGDLATSLTQRSLTLSTANLLILEKENIEDNWQLVFNSEDY